MQDINICDDEKTEFLKNSDKYSKCYVCLNYTLLLSPCECKSPICDDCFNNVLKNNGKNCTICKNSFDEDILQNIKIEISDSDESDESLEEDDYNESKKFLTIVKIVSGITIVPFLGFMFNQILYNNQLYIFTLENFIMGSLLLSFIVLILIISYTISNLLKYLCNYCLDTYCFYN